MRIKIDYLVLYLLLFGLLAFAIITTNCSPYYAAGSTYSNYAPFITVYNGWGTVVYQDYASNYQVFEGDLYINDHKYSGIWYRWEISR